VIKDVVLWLAFALYVLSLVWLVAIYMGVEGTYCFSKAGLWTNSRMTS